MNEEHGKAGWANTREEPPEREREGERERARGKPKQQTDEPGSGWARVADQADRQARLTNERRGRVSERERERERENVPGDKTRGSWGGEQRMQEAEDAEGEEGEERKSESERDDGKWKEGRRKDGEKLQKSEKAERERRGWERRTLTAQYCS